MKKWILDNLPTVWCILIILVSVLLISNHANACVDCDLNKKAFEKNAKVISVEGDIDTINYDKVTEILEKLEKADNSVYYDKIKTLEPKKVDGQYCYVKVIIKQKGDTIVKEEILECADGRKSLMVLVIGNYLLNSITEILILQNIADIILGKITLLSRSEKCV